MTDFKVNAKVLVAIAFLAASINSTTVAIICAVSVIFFCKDKALSVFAVDAVLLSMVYSIVYAVLNYLNTFAGYMGISMVTSMVSTVVSLVVTLVRLGVIVVSLMAALSVLDGREPKIPVLKNIHKEIDNIVAE